MKPYGSSLCLCASLIALTLPGAAQENPFNGSWKMDKSTLKYDGPTLTVTTDSDGYTFMRGDKVKHRVVCDGKPNPPDDGTITTCNKTSTGYELANTRSGRLSSKVKIDASADGKTMTRVATVMPPNDSPFTVTLVSKKVSGGAGAPVVWKEVSFDESQETGMLTIQIKGNSVDLKESDADKPVTCKLDGTPVPIPGGRTISAKMVGTHTLKITYTSDGKMWRENTFVLSPDGKSVKETDITPAPSVSSLSVLFHKA